MSTRPRAKRRPSGASAASDSGQNVKVAVRCRPMNEQEKTDHCAAVIQCETSRKEVSVKLDDVKMAAFNFDCVFDESATQEQVYRSVVADVVNDALQGFNCTVFAYGQTGTGKTYTMEGYRDVKKGNSPFWYGKHAGMIPRATQQIFQYLDACCTNYKVEASYLELYNEELIDLLNPDVDSKALNLHYDASKKAVVVPGLREVEVTCPEDLFKTLDIAATKRHTAETLLNKNSSRSHCVFTVTIRIQESLGNGEDLIRVGKLNLVDLAGSENTKRSGAKDDILKQAVMINQSLLALGRVITALTSGKNDMHIPYRDSKLTRLLQESLGGKAKTCLIATVSPSDDCLEETRSTLKYAFRAKDIKNKPVLSQQLTKKAQIKDYTHEIESLKNQLWAARSKEGFFVDPTTWESTLKELQQAKQDTEDLKLAVAVKDEQYSQLQEHHERKSTELSKSIEKCKQKEKELEEAVRARQDAEDALLQSKEALLDRDAVIARQVHTERNLTREATSLVSTVQDAAHDLQLLHKKVANQYLLSDRAQGIVTSHGDALSASINQLQENIGEHHSTQLQQHAAIRAIVDNQAASQVRILGTIQEAGTALKKLTSKFVEELHVTHTQNFQAQKDFNNELLQRRELGLKSSMDRAEELRQQCGSLMNELSEALQTQFKNLVRWKDNLMEMLDDVDSAAAQYSESHIEALQGLQEAAARLANETEEKMKDQNNTLTGVQLLHEELLDKAKADIMSKLQLALEDQLRAAKDELSQGLNIVSSGIQSTAAAVRAHAEAQAARVMQACDAGESYQMVHMEQTKNMRNNAEQLQAHSEKWLEEHRSTVSATTDRMAEGILADGEVRQQELRTAQQEVSVHLVDARAVVEEKLACQLHDMQDQTSTSIRQVQGSALQLQEQGCSAAQQIGGSLEEADRSLTEMVNVQSSGLAEAKSAVETVVADVGACKYETTASTPKKSKQYRYPASLPATCPHEEIVSQRRNGSLVEVPTDTEIVQLLTNLAEEHDKKEAEINQEADEQSLSTRRSPRLVHEDQTTTSKKRRTRSGSISSENSANVSTSQHQHQDGSKPSRARQVKAPRTYKTRLPSATEKAGTKRPKSTSVTDTTAAKRPRALRRKAV